MRLDYRWQAREAAGFDAQHFQIDWEREKATCPVGKISTGWTHAVDNRGNAVIKAKFSTTVCARRSAPRGRLPSGPNGNIKPYKQHGSVKRQTRFRQTMLAAP
jgi:hypothetical protein